MYMAGQNVGKTEKNSSYIFLRKKPSSCYSDRLLRKIENRFITIFTNMTVKTKKGNKGRLPEVNAQVESIAP